MRRLSIRNIIIIGTSISALSAAIPAYANSAEEDAAAAEAAAEIIVTGQRTTYNNAALDQRLIDDKPPVSSVLDVIGALPGVQINQGDAFGFDDWSTTVSVRGYQTNLDQQQVGTTIDGLPNGGSNYGGGAKANRFIDTQNVGTVEVFQGTADIGSRSNEALGGTMNFVTSDPLDELRVRLSGSLGDYSAKRGYVRLDTGLFMGGRAKAWVSYSRQEASDWMEGSAQNRRDHVAAKFIIDTPVKLTGYASFDDAQEDNYDQVYSAEQFVLAPNTDGLTGVWTGVPYQDQAYRRAWSTLRKNFFTYLKAETALTDAINVKAAGYYHNMVGRGDWVPQYVVDVRADGVGAPQSELTGASMVLGGSPLGRIYFVDAAGRSLTPAEGCVGAITYPYGGTSNPVYEPRCYAPGAIGAQSYRHTHYNSARMGGTLDADWKFELGAVENTLRGGIWYENTKRRERRDWHNVIDTRVGPDYATQPYWMQYSRRYPQHTFKWYLQDEVQYGPVTANFGIKQFSNGIDRVDNFDANGAASVSSKSRVLFSGGARVEPVKGLDMFAGYSENFKALTDDLLEFNNADFNSIKPETAKNWEAGVRYANRLVQASATWFKSKFANQVIYVPNSTSAGNDYLGEGSGKYFNAGGIDSDGVEVMANLTPARGLSLYGAYTYINAKYRGTGNAALDAEQGVIPGKQVAGIAKHMWVLSGNYAYGPFRMGMTGKFTGNRFVDAANTWQAASHFVADASVGIKGSAFGPRFSGLDLSLNVTNLTNERYLGGISGNYAWIAAPRTAVVTLTADF